MLARLPNDEPKKFNKGLTVHLAGAWENSLMQWVGLFYLVDRNRDPGHIEEHIVALDLEPQSETSKSMLALVTSAVVMQSMCDEAYALLTSDSSHSHLSQPSTVKHWKKNENTMRFVLFFGYAENWVLSWKKAISHFLWFYFRRFCFVVCPRCAECVYVSLVKSESNTLESSFAGKRARRAQQTVVGSLLFSSVDSFIQSIFNIAFVKECVIFGANIIFQTLFGSYQRNSLVDWTLLLWFGWKNYARLMHALNECYKFDLKNREICKTTKNRERKKKWTSELNHDESLSVSQKWKGGFTSVGESMSQR